jgi:hypothetical protein
MKNNYFLSSNLVSFGVKICSTILVIPVFKCICIFLDSIYCELYIFQLSLISVRRDKMTR